MPELLSQIQTKLGEIQQTASALPAGTDVSQASASLGDITKQVQSVIPVDTAQAPPPPTYEPSPKSDGLSLLAQIEKQSAELEARYKTQLEEANKRIAEAEKIQADMRAKQEGVLEEADPLTQPFRDELRKSERERFGVEEEYFHNQAMTSELRRLAMENVDITRKLLTQRVPGLAGLQQSSRMVKAQESVQSRISVLQAAISAGNNQIGTATNFIEESLRDIQADRQDRLSYLESLFNFYETTRTEEGNKIFNLTQDQKAIIQEQTNLLKADLARAEAVADTIKDIILNNPTMAHEAGLSLNDTMEEITQKIAKWEYSEELRGIRNEMSGKGILELTEAQANIKPDNEVLTYTDSRGNQTFFHVPQGVTSEIVGGFEVLKDAQGNVISQRQLPKGTAGTAGTSGTLVGFNFSPETNSVLVGTQDINKLTPSKQQEVRAELTSKFSMHRNEVHPQFKSLMSDLFNVDWTDDEIKDIWNDLRKELGIEVQTTTEGEEPVGSDLRGAWEQEMGGLQKESKGFKERLTDPKWYKPWTWGR